MKKEIEEFKAMEKHKQENKHIHSLKVSKIILLHICIKYTNIDSIIEWLARLQRDSKEQYLGEDKKQKVYSPQLLFCKDLL